MLDEPKIHNFCYQQVIQNLMDAFKAMWRTLKYPVVWRLCLYMYLSLALSFDISDGVFYWMTDAEGGPRFSKESIGYISAIGSVGSLLGSILYQYGLKDHPFRELLFWTQLLYGLWGMLDLVFVLRLNLRFGIPDYLFVVIDGCISKMIFQLNWMPLLVLTVKLCPPGIEGIFFALLMSIDTFGLRTSLWGGGFLISILNVTSTQFGKLWLAVLIRSILRVTPLCMLFLVPRSDPNSSLLPSEVLGSGDGAHEAPALSQDQNVELVSLVESMDTPR
nr:probable folate-biopterin transporter 2 [Ipomoea batatas]